MLEWYHTALVVGACIAAILAWNVPRANLWLGLGALSFVVSSWWHTAGLPYGPAFGAATNLAICAALYAWAERRYELRIWNAFHLMIVIDILRMTGFIKSHYDFAVALEVANWLGILVVGATGILERAGDGIAAHRSDAGWFGVVRRVLFAPRKHPPFWLAH